MEAVVFGTETTHPLHKVRHALLLLHLSTLHLRMGLLLQYLQLEAANPSVARVEDHTVGRPYRHADFACLTRLLVSAKIFGLTVGKTVLKGFVATSGCQGLTDQISVSSVFDQFRIILPSEHILPGKRVFAHIEGKHAFQFTHTLE